MSTLATVGTCSYNGFTFPVESETVSFTATPVLDQAKRTIVSVVYSVMMHGVLHVNAPDTMDSTMTTVRRQLLGQAGAFRYENKGLGSISCNNSGQPAKDVMWGPAPKMLKLKPHGTRAVSIDWQVDVALPPECVNAKYSGVIMEVNFKLNFNVDTAGYQVRTYSGYFKIPMTRNTASTLTIPDNVDNYRSKVYPDPIANFRRKSSDWSIDEAKTRIDFTIVDEEMGPNIPPPGIVDVKASHEMSNTEPMKFVQYSSAINAQYEVARGYNVGLAFDHFLRLVQSRINQVTAFPSTVNTLVGSNAAAVYGLPSAGTPKGVPTILPVSFRASEPEIYGRTIVSLSMSYVILNPISPFLAIGLWSAVPDSSWPLWAKALQQSAWTPYGNAKLMFNKQDDALISLCETATVSSLSRSNIVLSPFPASTSTLVMKYPTPTNSWIEWQNRVEYEQGQSTITHTPLAGVSILNNFAGNANFGNKQGFTPPVIPNLPTTVIQQRSAPGLYITMTGYALRAGWEIAHPVLQSVGGVPVTPSGKQFFVQDQVGWAGAPIYGASWRLRYALPRPPGTLPAFPNPNMPGGNGGNGIIIGGPRV